jgi:serine/threonine protein kinase
LLGCIIYIFPRSGGGDVYLAQDEDSKELFILKGSALDSGSAVPNGKESEEQIEKKKKEIDVKKQKLEELVAVWKTAMAKSEYIVKYIDHWYDDVNKYSYVVMEYCAGGDLAQQIQKRIEENKQFSQQVYRNY